MSEDKIKVIKLIRELHILKGEAIEKDDYEFIIFLVGNIAFFYDDLMGKIKVNESKKTTTIINKERI